MSAKKGVGEKKSNIFFYIGFFFILVVRLFFSFFGEFNNSYFNLVSALFSTFLILIFIFWYNKRYRMTNFMILCIMCYSVLHILAVVFMVGDKFLMNVDLIGDYISFDHILHLFSAFILTFLFYNPFSKHSHWKNKNMFWVFLGLVIMGLAAMWEVYELFTVFVGLGDLVGGYVNNILDLVVAIIGIILACFVINDRENIPFKVV